MDDGVTTCIIHKNRSGATGDIDLTWLKSITRFENLSTMNDPIDGGAF
jgi:replicative DNA helicase